MIYPKKLQKGATIGLVCPSSPVSVQRREQSLGPKPTAHRPTRESSGQHGGQHKHRMHNKEILPAAQQNMAQAFGQQRREHGRHQGGGTPSAAPARPAGRAKGQQERDREFAEQQDQQPRPVHAVYLAKPEARRSRMTVTRICPG